MPPSLKTVEKHLAQLNALTKKTKSNSPRSRHTDAAHYRIMRKLTNSESIFLDEPAAIDALIETATEFESYRAKGSQIINDEFPRIFKAILWEIKKKLISCDYAPAEQTPQTVYSALQKIGSYALKIARGNGKRPRSMRSANIRQTYWQLLTSISEEAPFLEALNLAKDVAKNTKATIPEREGALDYLLTHLELENDQENQEHDKEKDPPEITEIKSIIETIRKNPPNRDILFQILDAEVNSGEIDQMTYLYDLEAWDGANEEE